MYLTLTKRRLLLVIFILILSFFVLAQFISVKSGGTELSTNAQRMGYIESLGIVLENDDFSLKSVIIPEEFGDVYNEYNKLQIRSGFDLKGYRGKTVEIYTYTANDGRAVNLMIYKNKLIGGDISELLVGGSMSALKG